MTFVADEREPKLPKWAQELLADERRKRALAERHLAQQIEKSVPTTIWYGDYDNPVYVPSLYGHQRFHMAMGGQPGNGGLYNEIQVSLKGAVLEISGGRGLIVRPQVSNVINKLLYRPVANLILKAGHCDILAEGVAREDSHMMHGVGEGFIARLRPVDFVESPMCPPLEVVRAVLQAGVEWLATSA